MASRNKVLLIIIDQLRADCINGALSDHVDLPNIQAFRKQAVTFSQHYSVTNPCGPSRASIFTGQYAMNHRSIRNGTPLSAAAPNLALEMRKSGYEPLLFGYTDTSHDPGTRHHNDPDLKTEEGLLPGVKEVVEQRLMQSVPWQMALISKGYDIPDYDRFYDPVSPDPKRVARPDDPAFYNAKDSDTAFLADRVIEHLSFAKSDNWFAMATFLRPHPPLVAPEPYNKMYPPDCLPLPSRLNTAKLEKNVHPIMASATSSPPMEKLVRACDGQIDAGNDADIQLIRSLYLGLATEVDAHIGRILNCLKDTGQFDDTMIVLQADHGEMLGDHWMWGKQHVYDPCFHIPLIIRDPMNPNQHGITVEEITESIDIAPTILGLKNLPIPRSMDGSSLVPFLEGHKPPDWKDSAMMELDMSEPDQITKVQETTGLASQQCNFSILREARFKLVHVNGGLPPLLFDLQTDPHELKNLAQDPDHAATLLRLTQKLLSHRMSHADQGLTGMKITPDGVFGQ